MPSPYLGISSNVAFPSAGTITGVTNTNPMVVTVSGSLPAQMTAVATAESGSTFPVDVQGVQGCTAANGLWQATVTGANTFTIPAAGNAPYTTGGTVAYQFPQSYNTPSAGDNRSSASVNVGLDALGDRTLLGFVNTGTYKLAKVITAQASQDSNTSWAQQVNVTNTWTLPSVSPAWEVPGVVSGDYIDVALTCTGLAAASGGASLALFSLLFTVEAPGIAPTGYEKFGASNQGIIPSATAIYPMQLRSSTVLSGFGNMFFSPGFYAVGGSGTSFSLQGDFTFQAYVWRPTGVPQ